jgi:hypothetical protein
MKTYFAKTLPATFTEDQINEALNGPDVPPQMVLKTVTYNPENKTLLFIFFIDFKTITEEVDQLSQAVQAFARLDLFKLEET